MRTLILSILLIGLCSCTAHQPFPEGDVVAAPWGYLKHCIIYNDSIYCEEFPDE